MIVFSTQRQTVGGDRCSSKVEGGREQMEDGEWKLESKEVLGGDGEKRIRGWGQGIRGANQGRGRIGA